MITRYILALLASFLFISTSWAEGTGTINSGVPTRALDGKSIGEIVRVLSSDSQVNQVLPPICDSLGFVWSLTKTGNSITGSVNICGDWPVTGSNTGLTVSLYADGTGINTCYCNDAVDMTGVVSLQSRTFSGTHTQLLGCAGSVPVTAGLCP